MIRFALLGLFGAVLLNQRQVNLANDYVRVLPDNRGGQKQNDLDPRDLPITSSKRGRTEILDTSHQKDHVRGEWGRYVSAPFDRTANQAC